MRRPRRKKKVFLPTRLFFWTSRRAAEQHVDFSELLGNRCIQLVQIGRLSYVGLHCQHAIPNRLHRILERLRVAPRDGYARAFFLQPLRCRKSDAAVSSGYHRHFSFESLHCFSPVSKSLLSWPL